MSNDQAFTPEIILIRAVRATSSLEGEIIKNRRAAPAARL
ncbi:hypothetical protein GGD54_002038 [Rhizobium tropici]|uniref:Uncharacterized protein n=1 Tax=Rhizobium tropici TaxID=398 RepID=A0ABR6QYI0_RHITR|nr:hypothetical protein [Rhizobium tropici]MBB5592947.1 hypothetical protein [Rhizobium tropici]MBB6491989.1 hypothetical protein [Rhizobium tropici]